MTAWPALPQWPAPPQPGECAPFYRPYVAAAVTAAADRTGGKSLGTALEDDATKWKRLLTDVAPEREQHRYAPGKWTLGQVVGHVTDAERMFVSRALAFARNDPGPYPPFDENSYATHSPADRRPLAALGAEFQAVRRATVLLFEGFEDDTWDRTGVASNCDFTVRALAWIVAGHSVHHRHVLMERYVQLPA